MTNQVISFSGGKDSTAMALEMLDRGEEIHSVIAFDTGWEFPQMFDHWDKFEKYTGLEIVRIRPKESFDHSLVHRPVTASKGEKKGEVYQYGYGWPSPMRRWCTTEKIRGILKYLKNIEDPISCIGFASDEKHRSEGKSDEKYPQRYPLIEWDIDEVEALKICKKHGFDWGGLYDNFNRVSCFCCPLQPLPSIRTLRSKYPELWERMMKLDAQYEGNNPGFYEYCNVHEMEKRFQAEEQLGAHFNIRKYNNSIKMRAALDELNKSPDNIVRQRGLIDF